VNASDAVAPCPLLPATPKCGEAMVTIVVLRRWRLRDAICSLGPHKHGEFKRGRAITTIICSAGGSSLEDERQSDAS
jgi:hypothetical protein